jgi:REP element-mobilizing transposase RayT
VTFWRLHYHLIWATSERQPALTANEKVFYGVLYGKAKEMGLKIHAAGNVEDHIHIVISVPPKLALADCIKHIKGASACAINHMPDSDGQFKWQEVWCADNWRALPGSGDGVCSPAKGAS